MLRRGRAALLGIAVTTQACVQAEPRQPIPSRGEVAPELWSWDMGQVATLVVAGLTGAALLVWWLHRSKFGQIAGNPVGSAKDTLVGWERERILAAAKGMASGSAGFLVSILSMLLKGEIAPQIRGYTLLGLVAGIIGTLVIAAILSRRTQDLVNANYP